VIALFEQCHDDHPVTKFMGVCNDLKRELTLCLRAEVCTRSCVLTAADNETKYKFGQGSEEERRD
jgi:Cytochrome c oxidase biogenesis protein Cmc1 like